MESVDTEGQLYTVFCRGSTSGLFVNPSWCDYVLLKKIVISFTFFGARSTSMTVTITQQQWQTLSHTHTAMHRFYFFCTLTLKAVLQVLYLGCFSPDRMSSWWMGSQAWAKWWRGNNGFLSLSLHWTRFKKPIKSRRYGIGVNEGRVLLCLRYTHEISSSSVEAAKENTSPFAFLIAILVEVFV